MGVLHIAHVKPQEDQSLEFIEDRIFLAERALGLLSESEENQKVPKDVTVTITKITQTGDRLQQCKDDLINFEREAEKVVFLGAFNHATGVKPVTSVERTAYYREKAAGMYSALPYSLGQVRI